MKTLFSKLLLLSVPFTVQATPILESYWESWNSEVSVETIVDMHSDVIDISFGTFQRTEEGFEVSGVQASDDNIHRLVELAHQNNKKVKLSIGGATYPLSPLLKTSEDAGEMATALQQYCAQFNLDGVDFDIEDYPAAELQSELIAQTRLLMGDDAILTYTPKAPASTTSPYTEVIQASYPHLNGINIMAYDTYPGYSYETDAENLEALEVPKEIIVIGLMPGVDDVGAMTSLDDVRAASEYVLNSGLGGVMIWDLNRDHLNLTGLGEDASTNTVWDVFHETSQCTGCGKDF